MDIAYEITLSGICVFVHLNLIFVVIVLMICERLRSQISCNSGIKFIR